jgi:hypothetical protein
MTVRNNSEEQDVDERIILIWILGNKVWGHGLVLSGSG